MGNSVNTSSASLITRPKSPIEKIKKPFILSIFIEHHKDLLDRIPFYEQNVQSKWIGDMRIGDDTARKPSLDDEIGTDTLVYPYLDPFFRRELKKNEAQNKKQIFAETEILSQPSVIVAASENLDLFTCFESESPLRTHFITVGRTQPILSPRYQANHVHLKAPDPNEFFNTVCLFVLDQEFDAFFDEVRKAEIRFDNNIPQVIASPRGKSGCWAFAFFLVWRLYRNKKIIVPRFEEKSFKLPSHIIELLTVFNFFYEKNIKFEVAQAWYPIFDACFVYKLINF